MKNFFLFSLLLLVASSSFASTDPEFEIKLKSKSFTPPVTEEFADAVRPTSFEADLQHIYRLVQFYDIPTREEKKLVAAAGLELLSYIPNKAFYARIDRGVPVSALKNLNIRSIVSVSGDFKLASDLASSNFPSWAKKGEDLLLQVNYFSAEDRLLLEQYLEDRNGKILGSLEKINVIYIQIPVGLLSDLANCPLIQWIDAVSPPSTPDGTKGKSTSRSNGLSTSYLGGRKYDGSGVVVALSDDGIIGPHIDQKGRVTTHSIRSIGNHGDMTSGIFTGAGNLDPTIAGMAPGADIHIYTQGALILVSSYEHIVNGVDNLNNLGIVITSTSYSQGLGGIYTSDAQFTDQQIQENPSIVHVLSAGNSGARDHGYGAGVGWANISGGIKAGKNVICAGNVTEDDVIHVTSSRGPAADGRIKPDLCAQGANHLSTDENYTYQVGSGTSASTPAIAGVMAQLYQAYKELNGGQNPASGLIKASLLNTAEDLGNPGPDFIHGWGRINGLKAVRILEDQRYLEGSLDQGGNNTHSVTIPENVAQVRIMVYWTDVAGNPSAAKALVNDLNIQVTSPSSDVYDPWVLDPTPTPAALAAPATRGVDNLNNVEQVTIDNPSAGEYSVSVEGFAVPEGPQNYFLLYDFIYDDIELTYPIGGEGLVPGDTETIVWDASAGSQQFSLSYTTDGGASYSPISSSISSTSRSFDWLVPASASGEVLIKLTRGNATSESQANLTIIDVPQNLRIIKACPDTIEIGWDQVNSATAYEVSMLGEKYMDSIAITTENSIKIGGLSPSVEHWFSVRSILNGAKGQRAIAVQQTLGTLNCTLENDLGLVDLAFPSKVILSECFDEDNSNVRVNVSNFGTEVASGVELNYRIDGGPTVNESVTSDIASGESIEFVFAAAPDFSVVGLYDIEVWTTWGTDEYTFNDTVRNTIGVYSSSLVTDFPHMETFNSFEDCSRSSDCELVTCDLQNGWLNVNNSEVDDIDWRTDSDGTGTRNTGPSGDYDSADGQGKYLYLEGTQGCNFREASLFSPCIDLSSAACASLEFAYHMFGTDIGELHVDVISGLDETIDIVTPITGNQGDQWSLLNVDLTPFVGQVINVKIRGSIGLGTRADLAIDAMTFNVEQSPSANFTFDGGGPGNSIQFASTSVIGSNPSYLWDFGDGNTSTDQNPLHQYQNEGTYDVTLTITSACGTDTITQSVAVFSSAIKDPDDLSSRISVYPNPTRENVTVVLPAEILNRDVDIRLKDVVGKSILLFSSQNEEEVIVQTRDLSSGIYFIEIRGEDFSVSRRIVKH